jgi:hypothetical protein
MIRNPPSKGFRAQQRPEQVEEKAQRHRAAEEKLQHGGQTRSQAKVYRAISAKPPRPRRMRVMSSMMFPLAVRAWAGAGRRFSQEAARVRWGRTAGGVKKA